MKKRNLLAIALIAVLAFTLGMGTIAAYKKTFSSPDNLVRAAKFEVDSNGTLDQNVEFDLREKPICPGFEDDIYEFEIDKKDTEVPVKYTITVTPKGDLFANVGDNVSPVKLILYRETDEGWVAVENTFEINPVENPVEKFKVGLRWEDSDYDIAYQNMTGKVEINVVAEQVEGEPEEEEEPTPEPETDQEIVEAAKAHLIELGDNGLENKNPKQLDLVFIRAPRDFNEAVYTFSEDFKYDQSERTDGTISRRSSTSEGVIFEIQAKRDTNVDYTARVKLEIKKGEITDFVTYEISVPKNGVRKTPFNEGIPAEALTITLLP